MYLISKEKPSTILFTTVIVEKFVKKNYSFKVHNLIQHQCHVVFVNA